MADIILTTLNAKYIHAAFGLRYLYANLKDLKAQSEVLEFTIKDDVEIVAQKLLHNSPKIIGLGVYIWNVTLTKKLVQILKEKSPQTMIVLGGPEVTHETKNQSIVEFCDHVICGEGEDLFYELCQKELQKQNDLPKIIKGELPNLTTLKRPYDLYNADDIKNRVIYVEASRGCPYKCEFCLSSLDESVREFPLDEFLNDMKTLIQKGVKQFKFVDRTFNLKIKTSVKILEFFLQHLDKNLFLHFELVPDRLPEELKALIQKFPKGSLQFEIGIQTFNKQTATLISRRQNLKKLKENFEFLNDKTHVHTHADLIIGLPAENQESFKQGFDHLISLKPDEIQVGILKRLNGTPIVRHQSAFEMVFSKKEPYEIVSCKDISKTQMDALKVFAKIWDLVANRGNFNHTNAFVFKRLTQNKLSYFDFYFELSDFIFKRFQRTYALVLQDLAFEYYRFLKIKFSETDAVLLELFYQDYVLPKNRRVPEFLKEFAANLETDKYKVSSHLLKASNAPKRQKAHF